MRPRQRCRLLFAAITAPVLLATGCGGGGGKSAGTFKGTPYESAPVIDIYGTYTDALKRELRSCGVKGDIGDLITNLKRGGQQLHGVHEFSEPDPNGAMRLVRRIEIKSVAWRGEVFYSVNCVDLRSQGQSTLAIAPIPNPPKSVPADTVAVVGDDAISRAELDGLLARAQGPPKTGSPEYKELQANGVSFLVERVEYAQQAKQLGITVTDQDVESRLRQLKQKEYGGDEKRYEAALRQQGVTDELVRENIRADLSRRHSSRESHVTFE